MDKGLIQLTFIKCIELCNTYIHILNTFNTVYFCNFFFVFVILIELWNK